MNWALITLFALILMGIGAVLHLMNRAVINPEDDKDKEHFSVDVLAAAVFEHINDEINADYAEMELAVSEIRKRENEAEDLKTWIRDCTMGDPAERNSIKGKIREILELEEGVSSETINLIIPFNDPDAMTARDKFEYLYAIFQREFETHTLAHMDEEFHFTDPKYDDNGYVYYEVTAHDIDRAYEENSRVGALDDKFEVVVQRIYETMYGHDVADIFIYDDAVNDIEGGTGGKLHDHYNFFQEKTAREKGETIKKASNNYDVLYVKLGGKLMRMSFLSFRTEENLIRVVQNICTNTAKAALSRVNPRVQAKLKDVGESRVISVCPDEAAWSFWVRHPASAEARDIHYLITHKNNEYPIRLIEAVVRGQFNVLITGNVGGGKTSLLKTIAGFLDPRFEIRTIETDAELIYNDLYPEKNVVSLVETDTKTLYDCITDTKRMNTDVLIVGEINEPRLASAFVQSTQTGSNSGFSTMHPKSTEDAIDYLQQSEIAEGIPAEVAIKQIIRSFNFDIHQVHDAEGNYYVEYINEVVPYVYGDYPEDPTEAQIEFYRRTTNRKYYEINHILVFDKETMSYKVVGNLSEASRERLAIKAGKDLCDAIVQMLDNAMAENNGEIYYAADIAG